MPQVADIYDESLVDLNSWNLLHMKGGDIGCGLGVSHSFPSQAYIYSYQSYSGSEIGGSWCPISEMRVGRLLAYAAAVRWDAEFA